MVLLQLPTSATTLLRIIRRLFASPTAMPRVVGVDDWAKRKGTAYGTILVDLERHQVIDLLPDRTAETVEQWLKDHPGIEVVTRDRSTEYARGVTTHCVNIGWDTSYSEFSVEFEGEEEHHDTKEWRETQQKWHRCRQPA
ncbi:MAG: transposase [Ardenticatenaceae bacterium]|nr:transposase [Ardenticatenaceae bacterium]